MSLNAAIAGTLGADTSKLRPSGPLWHSAGPGYPVPVTVAIGRA